MLAHSYIRLRTQKRNERIYRKFISDVFGLNIISTHRDFNLIHSYTFLCNVASLYNRLINRQDPFPVFDIDVAVRGDIYVRCYQYSKGRASLFFRVQFHTGFVSRESPTFVLSKYELDEACKDPRWVTQLIGFAFGMLVLARVI